MECEGIVGPKHDLRLAKQGRQVPKGRLVIDKGVVVEFARLLGRGPLDAILERRKDLVAFFETRKQKSQRASTMAERDPQPRPAQVNVRADHGGRREADIARIGEDLLQLRRAD